MIRLKMLVVILLTLYLPGCSQERTHLSDKIKNINPYIVGQKLRFVSSVGIESTLQITNIEDGRFPDGLGAYLNERLVIDAFRESATVKRGAEIRILTLLAKDQKSDERIDFSLSLKEAYLEMEYVSFSEYQNMPTINFTTSFGNYDDVMIFDNNPRRRIYNNEIVRFYWSKSMGYIRLIQEDGTIWDLTSVD